MPTSLHEMVVLGWPNSTFYFKVVLHSNFLNLKILMGHEKAFLSPLQGDKFAQYVEGLRAYITVTKSPFVILSLGTGQDPFLLEH